jgi:transmembrane 9 superfamily protein 3
MIQVVEANLTMGNPKHLDWEDANRQAISFTYSVSWHPSQIKFDDRFVKYLDSDFFEHKVASLLCIISVLISLDSLVLHLQLVHGI